MCSANHRGRLPRISLERCRRIGGWARPIFSTADVIALLICIYNVVGMVEGIWKWKRG